MAPRRRPNIYSVAMYIVISKPNRMSSKDGLHQCIAVPPLPERSLRGLPDPCAPFGAKLLCDLHDSWLSWNVRAGAHENHEFRRSRWRQSIEGGVRSRLEREARRAMSLRLQINIAITVLMLLFIGALVAIEIDGSRRSVAEEMEASSRIAGQLLAQMAERSDAASVRAFLAQLGRLRASEIELSGVDGAVLYRSPPATYKAGRDAPRWFANLVTPKLDPQMFRLADGAL